MLMLLHACAHVKRILPTIPPFWENFRILVIYLEFKKTVLTKAMRGDIMNENVNVSKAQNKQARHPYFTIPYRCIHSSLETCI